MRRLKLNFSWLYTHMLWVASRFGLEPVGDSALVGVRKAGTRLKYVESIGHELAHMICLGPGVWTSKQIAEHIDKLTREHADEQECKACAVEILGLEGLLFPRPLRSFVPANAIQSVSALGGPEVFQRIHDLIEEPRIIMKAQEFVEVVRIAQRPPKQLQLTLEKNDAAIR